MESCKAEIGAIPMNRSVSPVGTGADGVHLLCPLYQIHQRIYPLNAKLNAKLSFHTLQLWFLQKYQALRPPSPQYQQQNFYCTVQTKQ